MNPNYENERNIFENEDIIIPLGKVLSISKRDMAIYTSMVNYKFSNTEEFERFCTKYRAYKVHNI